MLNRTAALALAAVAILAETGAARADFKVKTPDVNPGEFAIETLGDAGFDHNPSKNGERSYTAEVEYGLTRWWQAELEFEFSRDPGPNQPSHFNQITLENLFQFTERGEYWFDTGFFVEYGQGTERGSTNETTFGPVIRKDFAGTSNSLNLFFQTDLGAHADGHVQLLWAWETRIDAWQMKLGRSVTVEPGLQIYGAPGPIGRFAQWKDQDNRAGPQLFGEIHELGPGTLVWNAGVLFGLTSAVPLLTPRWQLEYELHF